MLRITGGRVYDPANGVHGEVKDVLMSGGRITGEAAGPVVRTIDASGMVIFPGGVDIHTHVAGAALNFARAMTPENHRVAAKFIHSPTLRAGTGGTTPTTFATGYLYAGMGYTTAFDAAIPPLAARHVHEEFDDTPCIDKGFYVLVGNNHYIMQAIQDQEPERLKAFLGWLLSAAKGYAPKIVNPGGVEVWKQQQGGNVSGLDSLVEYFNVTPRQIIGGIARAAEELKLPHRVHIHARLEKNLGCFQAALTHGKEKWRKSGVGECRVNVCAGFEEEIDNFGIAIRGSPHQSGLSAALPGIHVGAAFNQGIDRAGLAGASRRHEDRFPAAQSRVRIGAAFAHGPTHERLSPDYQHA